MEEEKEEYTDTPPSHIIYEGKNLIYLTNKMSLNTLAISINNLSMDNISFQTLKNVSGLKATKAYGIIGIANFKSIPCLVYGTEFDTITFYLDKAVYKIQNIKYIILNQCENNLFLFSK